MTMPTGKKIEKPQIEIRCLECGKGKPLIISGDLEWKINLIGDWEFIHECGNKITLPKDYLEESK